MRSPAHVLQALFVCIGLSLGHAAVHAGPVCVDPGGIGGTGAPAQHAGAGGTGSPVPAHGIGGTGAPAAQGPGGLGGTGAMASGGLGGTGAPAAQGPGGLGGTGAVASGGLGGTGAPASNGGLGGTGIVGTITGFASICVNGVEVHFEDNVSMSENGISTLTNRLAIGQVVAIEAGASGRGLEARRISILNAYEGPVTALPSATEPLKVMGRPVLLAGGARVEPGLRQGDAVKVSGFRNARGEVVATRIDRAPDLTDFSVIGTVDASGSVAGLPVAGGALDQRSSGREMLVRGRWTGDAMQITQTSVDPSVPFEGRVERAIVEGLILDQDGARLEISGFSVVMEPGTEFSGGQITELDADRRVRVSGVFSGAREVKATRVEFVREGPDLDSGRGRGRPEGGDSSDEVDDGDGSGGNRSRSRRDDDGRSRTETEVERGSSREKIDRRTENASGELERRERTEIRERDGRVEIRERIEIYKDGVRIERVERIDKGERPEKVERPDKVERPEKIERPEKVERPEKIEKD